MRAWWWSSCIAALLVTSSLPARAADKAPPLVVHIVDCANVPSLVMIAAQHTMTRAFGVAGIDVRWREERSAPSPDLGPNHVTILILSRPMVDRKTIRDQIPANALGSAAPRPIRRAWIFADRVVAEAYRRRLPLGPVLGTVIAHEAAHVVADIAHSTDGIMGNALRMNGERFEGFNQEQSRSILAALRTPLLARGLDGIAPGRPHTEWRPERLEARR